MSRGKHFFYGTHRTHARPAGTDANERARERLFFSPLLAVPSSPVAETFFITGRGVHKRGGGSAHLKCDKCFRKT